MQEKILEFLSVFPCDSYSLFLSSLYPSSVEKVAEKENKSRLPEDAKNKNVCMSASVVSVLSLFRFLFFAEIASFWCIEFILLLHSIFPSNGDEGSKGNQSSRGSRLREREREREREGWYWYECMHEIDSWLLYLFLRDLSCRGKGLSGDAFYSLFYSPFYSLSRILELMMLFLSTSWCNTLQDALLQTF